MRLFALIIFVLCPFWGISDEVTCFKAVHLVNQQNADLMAKYIYAKLRDWGADTQFGEEIYAKHLKIWDGFEQKRSCEDCLINFNGILDSVKKEGFNYNLSVVPIDGGGKIFDGAHRVAACVLYDKEVYCQQLSESDCTSPSFSYFKENGLEEKYLDAMAIQYCELKKNTFVLVLFPSASEKVHQVEAICNRFGQIIHKKELFLNANGAFHFILQLYDIGTYAENLNHAKYKVELCFPDALLKTNPLRIYLFECENLEKVKKCKKTIREMYGNNHCSVHSTDTHQESLNLAKLMFNKNSIHLLNHKKLSHFETFNALLEKHRNCLESTGKISEWLILDDSAVLSVYGLKECSSLDSIDFNHVEPEYHSYRKDEILFDPDHYFYYRGLKFCTLDVVKKMKLNRNYPADSSDIALIDSLYQ